MTAESTSDLEGYLPIAAYGLIGNCHTAALVANTGAIDWYCPGRFDAPAVFCRILDAGRGGTFRVGPAGRFAVTRRYRGATNLLEAEFQAAGGRFRVTDFMPVAHCAPTCAGSDVAPARRILRLVEGLGGEAEVEVVFKPTFDFARGETAVTLAPGRGAVAGAGRQYLALACPGLELAPDGKGAWRGRLTLRADERRWLALAYADDEEGAGAALVAGDPEADLARTEAYWRRWSETCTYVGPYRDRVLRSALALKLLTYEPTGAIVAAPTTSLPEAIGGVRNWDYRYTWLRDAALILYALITIGYDREADDFFRWLDRTCGADPTRAPQIMYTLDGGLELPERTLDHLEGYRRSRPVRVGNAAAAQTQLDIYGEVLNAAHVRFRRATEAGSTALAGEGAPGDLLPDTWDVLSGLVEQAAERWREPDHGLWEVRGGRRLFLYSRLMCWVALDRGVRLAEDFGLPAPLGRWRQTREVIRAAILEHGFNAEIGAFTQAFDSPHLDASALTIPRIGFLPATDPRVQSTIDRIRAELTHGGLVYRYRSPDGLPGEEATFAMCTFWLVDALALAGRLEEAHDLFERLVSYANDVGLLAEEIDPASGELLGNFPQGFTHLSLIRSAVNLAKVAKHGAEEESETEAERAPRARRAAAEGHSALHGRDSPRPRG